jgi:hypothetical protein
MQSAETIRVGRAICEHNGKVEWIKAAMAENHPKFLLTLSAPVEISFLSEAVIRYWPGGHISGRL